MSSLMIRDLISFLVVDVVTFLATRAVLKRCNSNEERYDKEFLRCLCEDLVNKPSCSSVNQVNGHGSNVAGNPKSEATQGPLNKIKQLFCSEDTEESSTSTVSEPDANVPESCMNMNHLAQSSASTTESENPIDLDCESKSLSEGESMSRDDTGNLDDVCGNTNPNSSLSSMLVGLLSNISKKISYASITSENPSENRSGNPSENQEVSGGQRQQNSIKTSCFQESLPEVCAALCSKDLKTLKRSAQMMDDTNAHAPCSSKSKKRKLNVSDASNITERSLLFDMFDCIQKRLGSVRDEEEKFMTQRANLMWSVLRERKTDDKSFQKWEFHQKIAFLWTMVSPNDTTDDPFQNFQNWKKSESPTETEEFGEKVKKAWDQMEFGERYPFIMQGFLYRVLVNQVDIDDEEMLKNLFNQDLNKYF